MEVIIYLGPPNQLRNVCTTTTSIFVRGLHWKTLIVNPHISDVSAPFSAMRGEAVEPEKLLQATPDVQVGPGQQHHDPRVQRIYTEELRREPITDK